MIVLTGVKQKFEDREALQKVQIIFDNITFTNSDIVQGTFNLSKSMGSGRIGFGNCEAAELTFTLDNHDGRFDNLHLNGQECNVYLFAGEITSSTTNRTQLGYFTVDSMTRTKTTVEITALDRMCRLDKVVDWSSFGEQKTLQNTAQWCATQASLGWSFTGSHPNTNVYVTRDSIPDKDNMSYRELLGYCLELMCANAYVSNTGIMKVSDYSSDPVYELKENHTYKYAHSDEKIVIDGFSCTQGDYKNSTQYTTGQNTGAIIDFSNNPLIQENPEQIIGSCKTHWDSLPDFYSFDATVDPIPWIQPGDVVLVTKYDGTQVRSFVTSIEIKLNTATDISNTCENFMISHASGTGLSAQQIRVLKQIETQTSEAKQEAEQNALAFTNTIANGIGLQHTVIDGQDYWFDGSTLENSTVVYTMNSGGFAWTKDYQGENTAWVYGVDKDGNAILNYLTVNKLTADQITAGSISADLLSTQYKNSVETKFEDYLLKTDYETGIEQTKDNILLYVQEHAMSMPNENLIVNSYHPVSTTGLLETCELISDPYSTDEWARNAFNIHQTQDGTNDSLYTSNRFPIDHNDDTYTLSFYLGKTTNVKSLKVSLCLANSLNSTGTESTTELVNIITPIQGKAGERIDLHFNDEVAISQTVGGVTYTKFTNLTKLLLLVSGYIKIEVGERILTTSEGYVYLDGVKFEKGDSATDIIASPNEVSDMYSKIKIDADQILLQVKNETKINPNMVMNSNHPTNKSGLLDSSCTVVDDPFNADPGLRYGFKIASGQNYRSNRFPIDQDTKYVVSMKFKKVVNVASLRWGIGVCTDAQKTGTSIITHWGLTTTNPTADTGDHRHVVNLNIDAFIQTIKDKNITNGFVYIYNVTAKDSTQDAYIIVDEIKVEAGDKATAWSAYPSEASITIDADSIRMQTTTLTWDAKNSSLTADGTLTANKAVLKKANISGDLTCNSGGLEAKITMGYIRLSQSSLDGYGTISYTNVDDGIRKKTGLSITSFGEMIELSSSDIVVYDHTTRRKGVGYSGTKNGIQFINGIAVG